MNGCGNWVAPRSIWHRQTINCKTNRWLADRNETKWKWSQSDIKMGNRSRSPTLTVFRMRFARHLADFEKEGRQKWKYERLRVPIFKLCWELSRTGRSTVLAWPVNELLRQNYFSERKMTAGRLHDGIDLMIPSETCWYYCESDSSTHRSTGTMIRRIWHREKTGCNQSLYVYGIMIIVWAHRCYHDHLADWWVNVQCSILDIELQPKVIKRWSPKWSMNPSNLGPG